MNKKVTTSKEIEDVSFLGENPVCDICQKPIKVDDEIKQQFSGIVRNYTLSDLDIPDLGVKFPDELGIESHTYRVYHVDCVKVN